ncbi:hypothetical protein OG400_19335 [Micromonospora ureilytica]|uniref:hypothetical protein n=1 Tax=Micromonospora ureilytica TaxID=709868 RepID=UPI002E0FEF69|nr:hypothetical protein OG400_19335 [Micromonospora ureilytica]
MAERDPRPFADRPDWAGDRRIALAAEYVFGNAAIRRLGAERWFVNFSVAVTTCWILSELELDEYLAGRDVEFPVDVGARAGVAANAARRELLTGRPTAEPGDLPDLSSASGVIDWVAQASRRGPQLRLSYVDGPELVDVGVLGDRVATKGGTPYIAETSISGRKQSPSWSTLPDAHGRPRHGDQARPPRGRTRVKAQQQLLSLQLTVSATIFGFAISRPGMPTRRFAQPTRQTGSRNRLCQRRMSSVASWSG